jgi:hypothetical protein
MPDIGRAIPSWREDDDVPAQATNQAAFVGRLAYVGVLAYVVSAIVLNGIDIGPLTPRAELLVLLAVALVWSRPSFDDLVPPSLRRPVWWLIGTFAAYVVWAVVARFVHGDPARDVLNRLFSDHLAGFAGFVVIVVWVTTTRRVRWLLVAMAAVLCADALLVLLQELDVRPAWDLWAELFADAATKITHPYDLPPGVVNGAFDHAFLVAALAPLVAVLAAADRRVARMLAGAAVTIGFVLLVRERAGIIAVVVIAVAWAILARRYFDGGLRALPGVRALLLTVAAGAVVLVVATTLVSHGTRFERDVSLTRLVRVDDSLRHDLLADAWPAFTDSPVFGSAETTIGEHSGRTLNPTSMFVDAAVFEGFPGLVLIVAVNIALLVLVIRAAAVLGRPGGDDSRERFVSRVALAVPVGVVAHLVASQLHNRGIWAGDYLPFWLAGIAVVAVRLGAGEVDRTRSAVDVRGS